MALQNICFCYACGLVCGVNVAFVCCCVVVVLCCVWLLILQYCCFVNFNDVVLSSCSVVVLHDFTVLCSCGIAYFCSVA